MPEVVTRASTVIDALEQSLAQAAAYNERSRVAPATILWTDEKGEWERLLPQLREQFPQLLTLGPYAPENRQGPAIWIKCMIAQTLPEASWDEDETPIIYLPGVSRRQVRAVEQCPKRLQPLAELQYRGVLWTQTNARDWTVRAFLMSTEGGLGLDVARDSKTQRTLQRVLPELAAAPLSQLRQQQIDGPFLQRLISEDPVRDLLQWLSAPDEQQNLWSAERWATFCDICRERFAFDPEKDGPLVAAKKLGSRTGPWASVWQRYVEAPAHYPGIPERLERARPSTTPDLFAREPTWPQDNRAAEEDLRKALSMLDGKSREEVLDTIQTLEDEHSRRREWVWAALAQAPLAVALQYLSQLASAVSKPIGGHTPHDVATTYVDEGWVADDAVLRALESVRHPEDVTVVKKALEVMYTSWLERGAEALQDAMREHGVPEPPAPRSCEDGDVLLFADALRYDVSQRLTARLQGQPLDIQSEWQWCALPSVTATAKPALAPVAEALGGVSSAGDFVPTHTATEKPITPRRFRLLMEEAGYQILADSDTGDPSGRAWTEIGTLDKHGHNEEWKMSWRIDEVVEQISVRIRQLLNAGWKRVHVVTDHGWLLAPSAFPKEDLPHYLTETRWGRCATLKQRAQTTHLTIPWHWDGDVRIAMAPGIHVHRRGLSYAHGGISVQECVVPRMVVTHTEASQHHPSIETVTWAGLRCRVQLANATDALMVDVRTRAQDPASSIVLSTKTPKDDGSVSLPVPEPSLEGAEAFVVVLQGEEVIATYSTTVGDYE